MKPAYNISTWIVADLPADRAIEQLAGAGFAGLELSADYAPLVKAWEGAPVETTQRLAQAGLRVASVHSPRAARRLDLPDEYEREASVEDCLRYFRLMASCGVPDVIIHPTSSGSGLSAEDWALRGAQSLKSLKTLSDAAAQMDVRLAVENLGSGPHRPAVTVASILELVSELGGHVGVCLDIGHSQQAGLDLSAELAVALESGRLFSLHLHDVREDLRDHLMPGEGTLDFSGLIRMLDEAGFEGNRTLEISPPDTATPRRVREAAALVGDWASWAEGSSG